MTSRVIALLLFAAASVPAAAQDPPLPAVARETRVQGAGQTVGTITVTGAHELTDRDVVAASGEHQGEPLRGTPETIAADVERQYQNRGYTFARVVALWDEGSGALTLQVDEGVIDLVEFLGVSEEVARRLADDFALKRGDVFNRTRAREALNALLRPTRGAITARNHPFDMVDTGSGRQLRIDLREPPGRFRLAPDLGEREDWFTAVDGFVPSLGFGAAVFDHRNFNHAFVAGHLSYKFAAERVGYALGVEKPFFGVRKLFVGGEVYDLTATDDDWRVTSFEASLDAMAARDSYRDYYRRRGVQLTAVFRPQPHAELLVAWRDQREEALATTSDFSFWDNDENFRPNRPAADGRLHAVLVGGSLSGRSFDEDTLEGTYLRHQLDTAYGERLPHLKRNEWLGRIDWQTEVSAPDALGSDFDFTRSILTGRFRTMLSPHQEFGARAIAGWSTGVLPPQRLFAVGGIGSVEAYPFKAQTGTGMALLNLEYALGWRDGFRVFGLYDVGRATTSASDAPWLKSVGFAFGIGDSLRLDFAYRTDDIPGSVQVLLRFGRTF